MRIFFSPIFCRLQFCTVSVSITCLRKYLFEEMDTTRFPITIHFVMAQFNHDWYEIPLFLRVSRFCKLYCLFDPNSIQVNNWISMQNQLNAKILKLWHWTIFWTKDFNRVDFKCFWPPKKCQNHTFWSIGSFIAVKFFTWYCRKTKILGNIVRTLYKRGNCT